MNLNDFVVLPNNKAKSVKLNARNLQELQMETVTLAQESNEMEEKLQQLKESMSKEKEERGHSGGFRWKSGQFGSLNSNAVTTGVKKNKENRLQKLSAGKVKIRVLKDEPLTAPPQPPPLPPPPRDRRKNRLRGTRCGQCEIKTAGVVCAECTEDYCIGCFNKFHQKGALKLHRMIPIQTDLQTHMSTRDVVGRFQEQINPSSDPATFTSHAVAKPKHLHPDPSQVLTEDHGEETKVEMIEKGQKMSFLKGEYNEVESARSFHEALRQWRGEKSEESGESMSEDAMWTPIQPVSVSVMATQADLSPDRGAVGRGGGEERVPVRVEFTENSLTYMDRLLLKNHRRTPVETYRPLLAFGTDLKSLPQANTGEETASSLTAQEEDIRRYCPSLFAFPVSSSPEPQITAPESCLVIEVMDERDKDTHGVVAEWRTDNNRNLPSVQLVLIKGALVPQTASTTGSSKVMHNQGAGPGSEQFCDPDGFRPLGLALKSGHSDTPEHTHRDPLLTGQTSPHDSDPTEGYGPSSSFNTYTEEHLVLRTRRNNRMQPTEILIHSTGPSSRGEISVNERGTSESGSSLCGKSTPTLYHGPKTNLLPVSPSLSHSPYLPHSTSPSCPTLGSELGPGFPPLSRAAQEIMEICSVDHTACEDPDLESDTTTHALHILEQELMATETWTRASEFGTGEDQH
ncbi:zinc finger B-box domain-containing protein 1 [Cyclopterus lumpus]|uniref:zinc finger B-box domain-containing protein 1 n=1 Tax=Cyclopterus lumpus TaxID=8103 RepID=UPI00148748B8|nr:zinc finger B-box domain-containing protein 1 [Cyclopterus lumpus]